MRRWCAPVLAAVVALVAGAVNPGIAQAGAFVSADGTTVVSDPVLPWTPAGSAQPTTLAATVAYQGSSCAPCSVHFYVEGVGWAEYATQYQYLSNGGSGRFTASLLPPAAGQHVVEVVLYGADGNPKETVGIGTLYVGGQASVGAATASAARVLPGDKVTVSAPVLAPTSAGTVGPAPAGTPFSVEFQAATSAQWVSVASGVSDDAGVAAAAVTPTGSGTWRVRSGSAVGQAVRVDVASAVLVAPVQASAASLPAGTSATLTTTVEGRFTWSAGAPVGGAPFVLQFSADGGTTWADVGTGVSAADGVVTALVRPTGSGLWRVSVGGASSSPTRVEVSAAVGTGAFRVGAARVAPGRVAAGDRVSVSASVQDMFTDGVVRAAPTGTPLEVEFRAAASPTVAAGAWTRAGAGTVSAQGLGGGTVAAARSGWWRVRVADHVGGAVFVSVAQPTGSVAFGALSVSRRSVVAGLSTTLTAPLTAGYTDGVVRPAPVGMSFLVQFAGSKAGPWRTVATRTVRTRGRAVAAVTVARSGYWRLVRGSRATGAGLVTAIPVKPVSVEASYWSSGLSLTAEAVVQANNGRTWAPRTMLVLQYRQSRLDPWRNVDAAYASGDSAASLLASLGFTGYYRVAAPAFGVASAEHVVTQ